MLREVAAHGSDETQATVAELLDLVVEIDDLLAPVDALPRIYGRRWKTAA